MPRAKNLQSGLTLVEVLVAAAIILVFISALISAHNLYLTTAFSGLKKVKAIFLAEEGIEAIKLMKDKSWTSNIAPLTNGTNYYLTYDSATSLWESIATNTYIDSLFERRFVLSAVYRDGNQDIASSGTLDANTKQVIVYVSWSEKGATSTKSVATYVTNLIGN